MAQGWWSGLSGSMLECLSSEREALNYHSATKKKKKKQNKKHKHGNLQLKVENIRNNYQQIHA
jgi:hypothetical protein